MPRSFTLLLASLVAAGAACGGDGEQRTAGSAATAQPSATAPPEDTGGEQGTGCAPAAGRERRDADFAKPRQELDASKTYVATVVTNCGKFKITLDARRAPRTGGSFKFLADEGFYDGLGFDRIVPGSLIQAGAPDGAGGGPGYAVVEPPPANLSYVRGVVAMAKTELDVPGTSRSQFFVVTAADAQLPPEFALLGRVTKGQHVVDTIGVAPVGPDERPVEPIVIESVKVAVS